MEHINFNTTFKSEDLEKFLDFLKQSDFEQVYWNEEEAVFVLEEEIDTKEATESDRFIGNITVHILKDKVTAEFDGAYYNYIQEQDHKFYRFYPFSDIKDAIGIIGWHFNNNPVNEYMVNTILYKDGEELGVEELERIRAQYLLCTGDEEEAEFLSDCGFKNINEYNYHICDLEAENKL